MPIAPCFVRQARSPRPLANLGRNVRVIVDYPAGAPLPAPGTTVDRDSTRPYEVTEVRRQSDGQLNVFVREIIKP